MEQTIKKEWDSEEQNVNKMSNNDFLKLMDEHLKEMKTRDPQIEETVDDEKQTQEPQKTLKQINREKKRM